MLKVVPTWEDVLQILERLDARLTALEREYEPTRLKMAETCRVSGVPYEVPIESVRGCRTRQD
jgi:hypothetical protein